MGGDAAHAGFTLQRPGRRYPSAMTNPRRVLGPIAAAALLLGAASGCGFQSIPQSDNAVSAAWGEVQNQYQRRADLVPNLVETVKGYATHERETLEGVMNARAKATQIQLTANDLTPENLKRFEEAQGQLRGALSRLMVVAENYPQLKANENFRALQDQLEGTENRIAVARRRYIQTVQEFNNLVTVPPTSWTNAVFYKKQPKAQFTATTPNAEQAPKVKF
jgi:LemA protein